MLAGEEQYRVGRVAFRLMALCHSNVTYEWSTSFVNVEEAKCCSLIRATGF